MELFMKWIYIHWLFYDSILEQHCDKCKQNISFFGLKIFVIKTKKIQYNICAS